MPMLASNDVGGSGTINLKHYFQNIRNKAFQTYAWDGATVQDYDVSKLKDTLKDTELLLFSGDKDAFSQP